MAKFADISTGVISFVARQTGVKVNRVNLDTAINFDLGIDGDDGSEFVEAFSKTFQVDMTGFRFDEYFGPEGLGCVPALILSWLWSRKAEGNTPARLVVSELVKAATQGSWQQRDTGAFR